jgi:hypothetical protein
MNLEGQSFQRLTVLGRVKGAKWLCRCACGSEKAVLTSSLLSGRSGSCGCLRKEIMRTRATTHGMSDSNEYNIWHKMLLRCTDPSNPGYINYGGRGVSVCDRWKSFQNFLADMGPRPSAEHSIDRYPNNDGDYEPDNCRWATRVEQNNNTRRNRMVEYLGQVMTLAQAIEKSGSAHRYGTILKRINSGWSVERALSKNIQRRS